MDPRNFVFSMGFPEHYSLLDRGRTIPSINQTLYIKLRMNPNLKMGHKNTYDGAH